MKTPFKLSAPPSGWLDRLPDGDYTIGRGADPRGSGVGEAMMTPKRPARGANRASRKASSKTKRKRSEQVAE